MKYETIVNQLNRKLDEKKCILSIQEKRALLKRLARLQLARIEEPTDDVLDEIYDIEEMLCCYDDEYSTEMTKLMYSDCIDCDLYSENTTYTKEKYEGIPNIKPPGAGWRSRETKTRIAIENTFEQTKKIFSLLWEEKIN